MRKFFIAVVALAYTLVAVGEDLHKVATSTEKRKVLLEEFTGLNCGWCPEGHAIAQQLLRLMPNEAYVIAVHAGYYSEPTTGQADYRTNEGTALSDYLETSEAGYPCGTVNRYCYYSNYYLSGRTQWIDIAKTINQQDAIVNLYAESQFDGTDRTLTVHVEGYYTGNIPTDQPQQLNVAWTQDDIVGYQNGGGAGDEYVHNHMLRGYLSDMWGDEIDDAETGQFFSRDYVCKLPEAVNGVEVKAEDINIVAFVTSGKTDVENVTGCKPHYINYATAEAGELRQPDFQIGTRYGYDFFEAKLKNSSSQTISTATFDVAVNNQTTTTTIDCAIDQFATANVIIPAAMSYADRGKTKYSITLKQLNGIDIEPTTISGSFQKPASTNTSIHVKMQTDERASENRICLKDANGNVVREFGPYADGMAYIIDETIDGLESGKTYCFEIYDVMGNGLLEGTNGNLTIHSGQGKLIDQLYTINGFGIRSFFTTESTNGIENVVDSEELQTRTFDLSGRRVDDNIKSNSGRATIYIKVDSNSNAKKIIKH